MMHNKNWMLLLIAALAWTDATLAEAQRIVSVAGAITEIVYALSSERRLVGVDATSFYPPPARQLPQVGYQRTLSAEGILSLTPDLVLATDAAGPPAVLEQIRAAGVAVRIVPNEWSVDGIVRKVRSVAEALDQSLDGERLATRLRAELDAALRLADAAQTRPKVLFLMSAGRGAPLAAGRDTAADAVIQWAGGRNALNEVQGYKPLSAEALTAASPDVLLLPDHTLAALGGEAGLSRIPGLTLTPAWRNRRIVSMDTLWLLGFGPRTATAVIALARRLHPDLETVEARLGR
ncbi:MAG: helical backbone metal receptor [Candidatus Contendobacter sp.]|nr:helical backbone metal receptor [Candidatus Contendobacter sp.]